MKRVFIKFLACFLVRFKKIHYLCRVKTIRIKFRYDSYTEHNRYEQGNSDK